jgi:hypothetical protein
MSTPTTYRLLGLVETPGQYQELIRLAELLQPSDQLSQLYLVYDCGPATPKVIEGLERAGATCIVAGGDTVNLMRRWALTDASWWRATVRVLRDTLRPPYLLRTYRKLLRLHKIDLVVVTEDSVAGRSRALIATAARMGVPVLLLPFTIPNPREAARILGRGRAYQVGLLARGLAALRPAWLRQMAEGRLIRVPVGQAIMNELVGIAPAQPWIDNTGPATIAVESRAMVRHYRDMGLAEKQLILTGSLADHVLEQSLRERTLRQAELRARFRLSDKPLLLCALPPDQLTSGGAISEFNNYEKLLAAWTAALRSVAESFAIVVRPHPRIDEPMLEQLQQAGVAVCWDDTATLVPLCDLYVAAISATIRWAIACGKPVLNYDVYRYRFDDYVGVSGILNVFDIDAFNQALADLAGNPERLASMTLAQSSVAEDWGCLDGESSHRIKSLVTSLLHQAAPAP